MFFIVTCFISDAGLWSWALSVALIRVFCILTWFFSRLIHYNMPVKRRPSGIYLVFELLKHWFLFHCTIDSFCAFPETQIIYKTRTAIMLLEVTMNGKCAAFDSVFGMFFYNFWINFSRVSRYRSCFTKGRYFIPI